VLLESGLASLHYESEQSTEEEEAAHRAVAYRVSAASIMQTTTDMPKVMKTCTGSGELAYYRRHS